ncbi:unnamed protein product, partial [Acanthoscelides obtectus]
EYKYRGQKLNGDTGDRPVLRDVRSLGTQELGPSGWSPKAERILGPYYATEKMREPADSDIFDLLANENTDRVVSPCSKVQRCTLQTVADLPIGAVGPGLGWPDIRGGQS